MTDPPPIDGPTAAEIERTAEDLCFEADSLENLARTLQEPAFGEIAIEARALAERTLEVRSRVAQNVKESA
jgi:hypothetical protein